MVDEFKKRYGVECFSALHHNKRKTNLHIHMIFAERKRLEQPIEKIAARNMFYDEQGRHARTKKEYLDYQAACVEYEQACGDKVQDTMSVRDRLRQKEQVVKIREAGRDDRTRHKDKGAR